jgi:hypothetical protein
MSEVYLVQDGFKPAKQQTVGVASTLEKAEDLKEQVVAKYLKSKDIPEEVLRTVIAVMTMPMNVLQVTEG